MENYLNFNESKVQGLTLEELRKTITEKYPNGTPVGGIYHYQLIDYLVDWLTTAGYEVEITDLFAANNRDKYSPGVTFDPVAADKFGEHNPQAYMLRRVYCNILLRPHNDQQMTSCCALSYSQRGISVAFGVHVKYCRNLSLLGASRVFSNYSLGIDMNPANLILNTQKCMDEVSAYINTEKAIHESILGEAERLQQASFSDSDFQTLLEMLVRLRVCHDSHDAVIHVKDEYALNSAQINSACERYYLERATRSTLITFWDALQIFNQDLKPDRADQPMIIPQSAQLGKAFVKLLSDK